MLFKQFTTTTTTTTTTYPVFLDILHEVKLIRGERLASEASFLCISGEMKIIDGVLELATGRRVYREK